MKGEETSVLKFNLNRQTVKLSRRFKINDAVNILDINPHPLHIASYKELNISPNYIEELF